MRLGNFRGDVKTQTKPLAIFIGSEPEERLKQALHGGTGDGFAVRAALGEACHLFHTRDHFITDQCAEGVGIIMDFMPTELHHINEETLDKAMTTDIQKGFTLAGWR